MPAGEVHHLRNLGFRNLVAEYTNNGQSLFVNRQHDFKGLRMIEAKKPLQHMHDKFHGCVVVVQQQHFVQRWSFGAGACFQNDGQVSVFVLRFSRHCDLRLQHERTLDSIV